MVWILIAGRQGECVMHPLGDRRPLHGLLEEPHDRALLDALADEHRGAVKDLGSRRGSVPCAAREVGAQRGHEQACATGTLEAAA
jgi:hypothetical protein